MFFLNLITQNILRNQTPPPSTLAGADYLHPRRDQSQQPPLPNLKHCQTSKPLPPLNPTGQ